MELVKARKMALNLMDEHGLIQKGWRFDFDNAKRRLGLCDFGIKRISISHYFTGAATEDEVEKAILHEIAHALVGTSVQAHGAEWKAKAISLGHSGDRLARNPYAEAQRLAARNTLPLTPSPVPTMTSGKIPTVGIGSVVIFKNKEYVIFKKATTRWHALNAHEQRRLTVPFSVAHLYVKV